MRPERIACIVSSIFGIGIHIGAFWWSVTIEPLPQEILNVYPLLASMIGFCQLFLIVAALNDKPSPRNRKSWTNRRLWKPRRSNLRAIR
ncbi:hypothetical protein HYW18_03620 [Candidatus Uhrbacteria bacterium]|nr:hypothetical protein [Candidatus Uhrbacteria bacterium]